MKILWADDQIDVIKTFKGLLDSITPQIVHVASGTAAIEKILDNYFDLLILDLMMPPDIWGGIWVLEELKSKNINIPTIILSSEGTQKETIKALRLGAKDYVLKENVEEELLKCVVKVLKENSNDNDLILTSKLPIILALPYKRYKHAKTSLAQLRRMIECYEYYIRIISIIGIAETKHHRDIIVNNKIVSILMKPSMGGWNQIRQFIKNNYKYKAFNDINYPLDDKNVSKIIELRNDISHGIDPSDKYATQQLEIYSSSFKHMVMNICSRFNYSMVIPQTMEYTGHMFIVKGNTLVADNVTLPKCEIYLDKPIICGQVYLYNTETGDTINLHPFILCDSANEPDVWRVLIYDGIKSDDARNLTGNEKMRYIDLWSGKRNEIVSNSCKSSLLTECVMFTN